MAEHASALSRARHAIARPWMIFNIEFVPGAVCTSTENVLIHSIVLVVLGLIVYGVSKGVSRFSQKVDGALL